MIKAGNSNSDPIKVEKLANYILQKETYYIKDLKASKKRDEQK